MPEVPSLLPQDAEAEEATLGCMLQNPLAILDVAELLCAQDFFEPRHQKLFNLVIEMERSGRPVDIVTVRNELAARKITDFGATLGELADSLATILTAVPIVANAVYYAGIVREKSIRRRAIMLGGEFRSRAADNQINIESVLEETTNALYAIADGPNPKGDFDFLGVVQDVFDSLEHRQHLTGVSTGFVQLDDMLSGLQAGELIVVGARPSMGKTAFGLNIALHAMESDVPALFFSLEMSSRSLVQRLICMHAQVDAHLVRRGMHSTADFARMKSAAESMDRPLVIDDSSCPTAYQIRATIRRTMRKGPIKLVIIDYLQLMQTTKSESRQIAVADISRELKSIARDLNIPVVVLAQLNRQVESRADNRPKMSDLRESGALEQDADVVLLLHREEYYNPKKEDIQGLAEVIVAKQRNGPTGAIQLHWNAQWTRFDNLSTEPSDLAVYRFHSHTQASPDPDVVPARLPYVEAEETAAGDVPW